MASHNGRATPTGMVSKSCRVRPEERERQGVREGAGQVGRREVEIEGGGDWG